MQRRSKVDWLLTGGLVLTLDEENRQFEPGAVAVRGAEIVAVGAQAEVASAVDPVEILDVSGTVVMPGLVNAHSHIPMTILRGVADDMPLEAWLERIWKLELAHATAENVRCGARLACAEMLRSGTTTVLDMYWHRDVVTEVAREVGFRMQNGPSFLDFVGPDGISPENRLKLAREYLDRYRNDPLISLAVQAHSTYTVPPELLEQCRDLAAEYEVQFITHAAETAAEVAQVQARYGKTPVELLDELGLLGPRTLLAHGVHLRDDEIALLAERDTAVVHCPESNLKLGSGIARIPALLAAGVTVGLGTDGAASNNDLDMWGEMHTAALLHKGVHEDPTVLSAQDMLKMATSGSAHALGLQDEIGSLEPGKLADLIVVDLDSLHALPRYDIYSHLVYAAHQHDVRTVFINGQPLMRNRELLTLDEESLKAEVLAVQRRIKS